MPYPDCTGAIEECLDCVCYDCKNDRVRSATKDGKKIRVDDFVKGENIFERSADHKREQKKKRQHAYYMANRDRNLKYHREYRKKRSAPCSAATKTGRKEQNIRFHYTKDNGISQGEIYEKS